MAGAGGGQIKLTSAPRGQLAELAGESGWLWALPDPPPAPLAKDMLAPLGVRLPPPRIDGDALLKIQIDARSPHNHVIKLHGQLARRFKNVLTRPVHAWHVDAPDRPHAYRDIGYSPGALAWYEQGGDWRQEGVAYIRYGPPPS